MDESSSLRGLGSAMSHVGDLYAELSWFAELLQNRLRQFQSDADADEGSEGVPAPPPLQPGGSTFADLIIECNLSVPERAIVALAICPWVCPFVLDPLLTRNSETQRGYTEFGGVCGANHSGFLPTGETAVFLLGGTDLSLRLHAVELLAPAGRLATSGLISLAPATSHEPFLAGILQPGPRMRALLFPDFIPAADVAPANLLLRKLETSLDWSHLVLSPNVLGLLEEICDWHRHQRTLLEDWGLRGRLRSGSINLFHGPSGTGKSLAAALLGKRCGVGVLRVDLSAVVSKYIGETEKNLSMAMEQAESSGAVLFFDEADALFGRRTRAETANDRFANQEVSYLLQRIEEFSGIIILASNLRMNIDDAFLRRFHLVIEFPMPQSAERLRLWQSAFGSRLSCHPDLSLERLSEKYELTGGAIVNVVRVAALRAAARGENLILPGDVLEGIRREYRKEGRPL